MKETKLLGSWGELQAADFLQKKGYRILGLNYSCRYGEIDIIACDSRFVVFAEVKLRKNASFAQAREYVTFSKQERIRSTAALWLSQNPTELQPRFDVVEVYAPQGMAGSVAIQHFADAFQ